VSEDDAHRGNTTTMIARSALGFNTGVVEVYKLNNNQITGAAFMGTVGLNWQFSGILADLRRRFFLRRRSLNLEL